MGDKKYTLDQSTSASNPGKIKFKPSVWVWHDTKNVVTYAALFLVPLVLTILHSWLWGLLALSALALNIYYWLHVSEHFSADSNLGVVISVDPPLVAVYTELQKYGNAYYPAIRVIDYKVSKPIKFGDEVATISVYQDDDDDSYMNIEHEPDFWVGFRPLPVEYATDNAEEIQAELDSYPVGQRALIMALVEQLPKPYEQRLYKVNVENSSWKQFDR